MAGGQRGRPKKVVQSRNEDALSQNNVESDEILEENGEFSPNNVLLDPVQQTSPMPTPPMTPTPTSTPTAPSPPALPTFESEDLTKLGAYFKELFDYKVGSLDSNFYKKSEIDEKFANRDEIIANLQLSNDTLLNRISQLECTANYLEQRDRNYSCKILYMNTEECGSAEDCIQHLWRYL